MHEDARIEGISMNISSMIRFTFRFIDRLALKYRDKTYSLVPICSVCLQFQNAFYGEARGWARIFFSSLRSYVPGIMNPHAKVVQRWNRFFVISCLLAVFVDPLFFLLLSVQQVWFCDFLDMEVYVDCLLRIMGTALRNGFDKIYFFISILGLLLINY